MTDTAAAPAEGAARRSSRPRFEPVLVPLICGTVGALFSQVITLKPKLSEFMVATGGEGWSWGWLPIALALGLSLECFALAMLRNAHLARLDDDSPTIFLIFAWAATLFAAAINWHHWTPVWNRPTLLGCVFAGLSIMSVAGWELREHREHRHRRRDRIKATGWAPEDIPPSPQFGAVRWVRYPAETFTAWSLAVRYRIPTSAEAIARAQEIRGLRGGVLTGVRGWVQVALWFVVVGPLPITNLSGPRDLGPAEDPVEADPGTPVPAVEAGPGSRVKRTPARRRTGSPKRVPVEAGPQRTGSLAIEAGPENPAGPGVPLTKDAFDDEFGAAPADVVDRVPAETDPERTVLISYTADMEPAAADPAPESDDDVFTALVAVGVKAAHDLREQGTTPTRESLLAAVRAQARVPRKYVNALWPAVREQLVDA